MEADYASDGVTVDEGSSSASLSSASTNLVLRRSCQVDHEERIVCQDFHALVLDLSLADVASDRHNLPTRDYMDDCNTGGHQVVMDTRINSAEVNHLTTFTGELQSRCSKDSLLQPPDRDFSLSGVRRSDSETQLFGFPLPHFAIGGKVCSSEDLNRVPSPDPASTPEPDYSPYSSDSADFFPKTGSCPDCQAPDSLTALYDSDDLVGNGSFQDETDFSVPAFCRTTVRRLQRIMSNERSSSVPASVSRSDRNAAVEVNGRATLDVTADEPVDGETSNSSMLDVVDSRTVPSEVWGDELWSDEERTSTSVSECYVKVTESARSRNLAVKRKRRNQKAADDGDKVKVKGLSRSPALVVKSPVFKTAPLPTRSKLCYRRISQPMIVSLDVAQMYQSNKELMLRNMLQVAWDEMLRLKMELQSGEKPGLLRQMQAIEAKVDSLSEELHRIRNAAETSDDGVSPKLVDIKNSSFQEDTDDPKNFTEFMQLTEKRAEFAVFIISVMDSGFHPAPLLFCVLVDNFMKAVGTLAELSRWASELYSTFLILHAPLWLKTDRQTLSAIKHVLKSTSKTDADLRTVFQPAIPFVSDAVDQLLSEFHAKNPSGCLSRRHHPALSHGAELKFVKNCLLKHFEDNFRPESVHAATASCIAYVLRQCGLIDVSRLESDVRQVESCPTFLINDSKAFWLKLSEKGYGVRGHNLFLAQSVRSVSCTVCGLAVWAAFDNGFYCIYCTQHVHKECLSKLRGSCAGTVVQRQTGKERPALPGASTDTSKDNEPVKRKSVFHVSLLDAEELNDEGAKSSQKPPLSAESVSSPVFAEMSSHTAITTSAAADTELTIETDMPTIENIVPAHVLLGLTKKERKRQDVIQELFYTERSHIRKLKVMYLVFYQPMCANSAIDRKIIDIIFPNLTELIQVHRQLNNDFIGRRRVGPIITRVADILFDNFSGEKGEKFSMACAKFCRDQTFVLQQLRMFSQRETRIGLFLREAATNPLCDKLQLKDLLMFEVSRLVKYPLLIDSLLKHTQPETSDEYKGLVVARSLVINLLHFVNDEVREQENWRKTLHIYSRLDKRPIESSTHPVLVELRNLNVTRHRLLHDGWLKWQLSRSKVLTVYVALFADIILLMQSYHDDNKLVLRCQTTTIVSGQDDTRILFSPIIRLRELLIRDNAIDECGFFLITASKSESRYSSYSFLYNLTARSKDEKTTWSQSIEKAIDDYKTQAYERPSNQLTVSLSTTEPALLASQQARFVDQTDGDVPDMPQTNLLYSDVAGIDVTDSDVRGQSSRSPMRQTVSSPSASSLLSSESMKQQILSVCQTLAEKRQYFAQVFSLPSYDDDDDNNVFETDADCDVKAVISSSQKKVRKLQKLLSQEPHLPAPSSDAAGSAEDTSGNDIVSTSGRTDVGAEGEAVLSLTSAQRANIDQLLERHAQLLMTMESVSSRASLSQVLSELTQLQQQPTDFTSLSQHSSCLATVTSLHPNEF